MSDGSAGSVSQGTVWRKTRTVPVLLAMAGMLFALLAMGATTAKAAEVGYELDNGVINLGGSDGTWATLIDQSIPDPPATLTAEADEAGALTAPAEAFTFPPKRIEDLETGNVNLPVVDAKILISAEGPITGFFSAATGVSNVTIPADVFITVYSAGSPSAVAKCRVDGFDLNLNTTAPALNDPGDPEADPPRPAATYDASPFAEPAGAGEGAMIASWAGLPPSEQEGGSLAGIVCPALDDLIGGPGATWLDGIAGENIDPPDPEPPLVAPKITGTPAASTESTTATFTFTQGDTETSTVTGFQCKLDTGAFEPCDEGTKTYAGQAVGSHTFEVKATNAQGEGPVSAPYSWTITEASEPCPSGTTGTPPNCVPDVTEKPAKLGALKVTPEMKAVKRGKKATFKAKIKNAGGESANGVKVCVTAPKKLVSVKKCVKIGSIAAGKTKTAKFKVTVKKKAKKGKKAVLKFKATSNNAGVKNAKATVKVK